MEKFINPHELFKKKSYTLFEIDNDGETQYENTKKMILYTGPVETSSTEAFSMESAYNELRIDIEDEAEEAAEIIMENKKLNKKPKTFVSTLIEVDGYKNIKRVISRVYLEEKRINVVKEYLIVEGEYPWTDEMVKVQE